MFRPSILIVVLQNPFARRFILNIGTYVAAALISE